MGLPRQLDGRRGARVRTHEYTLTGIAGAAHDVHMYRCAGIEHLGAEFALSCGDHTVC